MTNTYGVQCIENVTSFYFVDEYRFSLVVRSDTHNVLMSVLQPIAATISLLLNLCFIIVVLKNPSMRTVTNAYLTCLALSDILFSSHSALINFVAWYMTPYADDYVFMGTSGCIANTLITKVTYFFSIFIVTIVSFDRFMAICHPLKHRMMIGKTRTTRLILGCLVLATSFTIPVVYTKAFMYPLCLKYADGLEGLPAVFGTCRAKADRRSLLVARQMKFYVEIVPFVVSFIGEYALSISLGLPYLAVVKYTPPTHTHTDHENDQKFCMVWLILIVK